MRVGRSTSISCLSPFSTCAIIAPVGRFSALALFLISHVACAQPFWTSTQAGQKITWSAADLTAQPANFSFRAAATAGFDAYRKAMGDDAKGCTYERSLSLLSAVGPVLSFRDELYSSCPGAAHPSSGARFTSIDLSRSGAIGYEETGEGIPEVNIARPGRAVLLSTLFPETALLDALAKDSVLKQNLGERPASLKELQEQIGDASFEIPKNPCQFTLPKDYLTRFAFHHVENGKVAVRIALEPSGGACRNASAQLGLLLPVPAALAEPLARASRGTEGFLMSTSKRPSATSKTRIRFQAK